MSANDAQKNLATLAANSYPGRGIVIGKSTSGDHILQVYWLMGRSDNSRNRLLVQEGDMIKTVPFDKSKVEDPSLIIYNAMRVVTVASNTYHIVSNGDQTNTIVEYLEKGDSFEEAVRSRTYEPDAPNYTSRISGVVNAVDWTATMAIARRDPATGEPQHDSFAPNLTENGLGSCIHTYQGDGNPLPAFVGAPYVVPLGENAEDTAHIYWDKLNFENRIAIVVKSIAVESGETACFIINRF
jgi:IMP cyclohydrolase